MNNLASKLDFKGIQEIDPTFRKMRLEVIAKYNYDQSAAMTKAKKAGDNVSNQLLQIAKGVFIQELIKRGDLFDFEKLSREDKSAFGVEVYNQFEVELQEAEVKFCVGKDIDTIKEYRSFTGGGNWSNVRSKIKGALKFGYNIAAVDDLGVWVVPTVNELVKLYKEQEKLEEKVAQERLKKQSEAAMINSPEGQLQNEKNLLRQEFDEIVDFLGEGSNIVQSLVKIKKLREELRKSFFEKMYNHAINTKLMKSDTKALIKARIAKKESDFDAKLKEIKESKEETEIEDDEKIDSSENISDSSLDIEMEQENEDENLTQK